MHPLGTKITRVPLACHPDCKVCHPPPKGGRAIEKRRDRQEILGGMLDKEAEVSEYCQSLDLEDFLAYQEYLLFRSLRAKRC
jgi:uncharacterized protein (UPF0261 family)